MNARNASKYDADIKITFIIEQVKTGNLQAYTHIIRDFQKQIYLYCYYMLGSKEEAEDASQDIFIKGLENIGKFTNSVSLSAWLYKIANHHCIDLIKKRNKGFKMFTNLKKKQERDHQYINDDRYTEIIHELLEKLNIDERRILLLRALEEYSFNEIGSIMDLKSTTVRKKYERLRKKLIDH